MADEKLRAMRDTYISYEDAYEYTRQQFFGVLLAWLSVQNSFVF